jgi:predicted GTPase
LKIDIFLAILLSRIPLHVATIDNYTLVPLQDGNNISDKIVERLLEGDLDNIQEEDRDDTEENDDDETTAPGTNAHEKKTLLVERIIEMIRFGIYEDLLIKSEMPVHVVSIVGKQSGGKSYIMNRFFGTRFDVASERCTDGIWMSVSRIVRHDGKTQHFVVLDCEGLFSSRRNDQEEMKLCLTLSAISDIMILNQDLSFNRYLNQIFQSFTKSVGKLKGRNLF